MNYTEQYRHYDLIEVNSNLRYLREQKGISQKELADTTGISLRMIRYYETMAAMPSIINAYKLADCLNTTVDQLFPHSLAS